MNPKQLRVYRESRHQLRAKSFSLYCKAMAELFQTYESFEFCRTLSGYFRSKRYDLALAFADSLSEQTYSDATTHFVANQFAALIRKYPWDPKVVNTDPESKATTTFLKSEHKCARLNRKFWFYDNYRSPYEYKLDRMRNFIRYVLGIEPNIRQILDQCDFGSGASIGVHGSATNLLRKIGAKKWSVSTGASTLAALAVARHSQLREILLPKQQDYHCYDVGSFKESFRQKLSRVDYNTINFVPKTAKTHRAIAVEPLLNGFLQKGVDSEMRSRIKRIGIDLSDQSKNQRFARQGSTDDSEDGFVTIDLKSASDSISIGLCRSLLPERWFCLLDDLRSKSYKLNGKITTYHKFCSMGNGFCFPLETLIFVACCYSCGAGTPGIDFSVYGDDIIVRKRYASEVLGLLKVLGFTPNNGKTFLQGPFRESCGADWFGGVDVRPYTLDYSLDSIENLYKWLNLTQRNTMTSVFFEGVRRIIFNAVPLSFRFVRPYKGNADSGIDSYGDEYLQSRHCTFSRKQQRWKWKELEHTPVRDIAPDWASCPRYFVDMYALLRGSRSWNYSVVYTFRRKTRATVRMVSHGGSTSTWVPQVLCK